MGKRLRQRGLAFAPWRIDTRVSIGAFSNTWTLKTDRETRSIHHREHRGESGTLSFRLFRERIVKQHRAGRTCMDP